MTPTIGTIRRHIIKILLGISTLLLTVFLVLNVIQIYNEEYDNFEGITQTVNNVLVQHIRGYVYENDTEQLKFSRESVTSKYIKQLLILDNDGNVIAGPPEMMHRSYALFPELRRADGHVLDDYDRHIILTSFDILDVPVGYLVLEPDLSVYRKAVKNKLTLLAFYGLITLLVIFLASYIIANSISRPIELIVRKLQTATEDLPLSFPLQKQSEFEFLVESIAAKHNALLQLNRSLKTEVDRQTHSLQRLNAELKQRIAEEIEKSRQKDQQMLQHSRLAQMGEMISMIAHQWRQPLAAISSTINMLLLRIETDRLDPQLCNDRLHKIADFTQHLSQTIDDFRSFFQTNKEKNSGTLETVVEEVLQIIRISLHNKSIEVVTDFACNRRFAFYTNEIKQVLLNLVKNAEDALLDRRIVSPWIVLSTREEGAYAVLEVEDNAGGIDPAILEKIFDPYFSTKTAKDGTGLGLYMSKTIVRDHNGGTLTASNTQNGALFTIKLPLEP